MRNPDIKTLELIEEFFLPDMLRTNLDQWRGLDVLYHEPRVERVWAPLELQYSSYRVSLHVIHQTDSEKCLFHPHPWPSAMRIVKGGYEMGIGYGAGLETPPMACKVILAAGSSYEMNDSDGWHYVNPTEETSLSVMVSGKPWGREMPVEPGHGTNREMAPEEIEAILRMFREFYV